MRVLVLPLLLLLLLAACAPAGPQLKPNEQEWAAITADYQWLQTMRAAQAPPPPNATRKVEIETALGNLKKLEPLYDPFVAKAREYYDRTGDRRAAVLLAREKVTLGEQYANVLSRYDKAISLYREALELDPTNTVAAARIAEAEGRRFVDMSAFSKIRTGMKEQEVRGAIGLPREDWIKQVVQHNRVYSVWIYPKQDGGAAAIYFENGLVYHVNWNAAAPAAR